MSSVSHILFILLAATMFFTACKDRTPVIELTPDNSSVVKENMINANRVVIQSEGTQIDAYVERRGWKMESLPCGALYRIKTVGNGDLIQPDDTVMVSYRLETLDGTPFYTRQTDTLVVGRQEVTVALDDLLQRLSYGSQAQMIAPSNSAYGVVGDGDRVASRTVIVYDINEIKKINKIK